MDIAGAHVAITGASRGLGAAFAHELHARGATLSLIARDADRLTAIGCLFEAHTIAGDLLDPSFVDSLVPLVEQNAPVDIWINNAGIERTGLVTDQSAQDLRDVLQLNLETPVVLTRAALQAMADRGRGMIVNVSSVAMATNTPRFATYGASKSGLSAFTSTLRQELKGTPMHALTVEIGPVDTDMLRSLQNSTVGPLFERYRRSGLSPVMKAERVAKALADGIESDTAFVRLPRRSRFSTALTNVSRRLGDLAQTGVAHA